jgi:hypothetical protein
MEFKILVDDETILDKIIFSINVKGKGKEYNIRMKDIIVSSNVDNVENKCKTQTPFMDDILDKLNEPNDRFMKMEDRQLIDSVSKLLEMTNKMNISEYYKKNRKEINLRDFNLRGLVSNNLIKFNSESNRKKIRDLGRKCIEFIEMKQNEMIQSNNIELSNSEPIIKDQQKNEIRSETCIYKFKRGTKKLSNSEPIIKDQQKNEIRSETCIYKFKRGTKKGNICGMSSMADQSYCKMCYDHIKK